MRTSIMFAAAALIALPGAVAAQVSGSVQAEATVLAPITVANEADLQFGDVLPGLASTVAPASSDAGRFRVSGAGASEVALDFALPTVLTHTTSASTLPLSFGAGSAGVGTTAAAVSSTFDPSATFNANLSGGALFVFIGGTVTPAVSQEAGTYDGTITLTVAYTGS